MSVLIIHCPKCNKGLRLRDRSKLGKKAGCPKCGHTFIMHAPSNAQAEDEDDEDEVEFELVEAPAKPLVGKAARRIPDDEPPARPSSVVASKPGMLPDITDTEPPASYSPAGRGKKQGKGFAFPKIKFPKPSRRQIRSIVALGVAVILLGGGLFAAMNSGTKPKKIAKNKAEAVEEFEEFEDETNGTETAATPPAPPKPIDAWGLPMGSRVIVSMRVADLWQPKSKAEEFRYCLGPFAVWAEGHLKKICRRDLTQVEHLLIGFVPGVVGEFPKVGVVVRYSADIAPSQFITDFGGKEDRSQGYPVYVGETHTVMRKPNDLKTVAICPNGDLSMAMAQGAQGANPQSVGIDALLPKTDQNRHFSLIFEPRSVQRHQEAMFPVETRDFITQALRWFNDEEIETVVWSMHLGKDKFDSQIVLRNQTGFSEQRLNKAMQDKLKDLPFDLWHAVEKMEPKVAGPRQIIGRFPAMTQVFAKSTKTSVGPRLTMMETSLPERAAPNLALGALFAWDESTRTDFSKGANTGPKSTTNDALPDLIVDRLKKKIEIEFARAPLQEAFKYIAEECKTGHDIDGDALKFKGYTKNMPQTFTMQDSGLAAIKKIISAYPDMCLVIDEKQKMFLITTIPSTKDKGQTPYEFK